jgi:hypothetical protein
MSGVFDAAMRFPSSPLSRLAIYARSRRGWRSPTRSAPRRPRPQGSCQRSRWSRCHAPCWAAPGVPLRCVVGGAPHLSRAVLRPLPLRGIGHVPRQLLRGWRCRTLSMQQRASHPRANVRLRAMSQNLRSQVLRQALRLFPRATVIGHAAARSPLPKAMNRATRGVTVHAHTLRPCHALCERLR